MLGQMDKALHLCLIIVLFLNTSNGREFIQLLNE
jgi:hypothetical protein